MSQAKVDKYKEEKKNRAKIVRNQKIKKSLGLCLVCLVIGGLIGIPIGKVSYDRYSAKKAEEKTISGNEFNEWFDSYFVDNYSDFYTGASFATETDASETDSVY